MFLDRFDSEISLKNQKIHLIKIVLVHPLLMSVKSEIYLFYFSCRVESVFNVISITPSVPGDNVNQKLSIPYGDSRFCQ